MPSFASELWDKPDVVIKYSQDRRRQIEEFIVALNKRIDAEETYAKMVQEAARIAQKVRQGEESVSSLAFSSFKFDCVNRGGQSRIYAKSVKDEILTPLKQLLSIQNQQTKQMEKDYKKLEKQMYDLQLNVLKYKGRFQDDFRDKSETLMTNEIMLQSGKTAKDKRLKIVTKSSQILKNLIETQDNYERAVTEFNNFTQQYYIEISKLLETFQQHQKDRLARQQQNIIKMLIFQTSMMKNFQYDIITITKQVEKAKEFDDIKDFIIKNSTGRQRPPEKSILMEKDILAESVIRIVNKDFEKRVALEINKEFRKFIQKKFKGEPAQCSLFQEGKIQQFETLFKSVSKAWEGQTLQAKQISQIKDLLSDEVNRLAFLLYLQHYLLTFKVVIPQQGYQRMLVILHEFFDLCLLYQDVFTARKVTNLTFSFYTNKDDQKKYLHLGLNDCKIYSLLDYWKASTFESVQQELYLHFGDKLEQELQMREMSLILGQLAMYCHQMILLGVSSKNVRSVIGWFCRLYNIPEDQNRDLAKTISLSVKKYRQLFSLNQTTASVDSNPKSQKEIKEMFEQLQQKNLRKQSEGNPVFPKKQISEIQVMIKEQQKKQG